MFLKHGINFGYLPDVAIEGPLNIIKSLQLRSQVETIYDSSMVSLQSV